MEAAIVLQCPHGRNTRYPPTVDTHHLARLVPPLPRQAIADLQQQLNRAIAIEWTRRSEFPYRGPRYILQQLLGLLLIGVGSPFVRLWIGIPVVVIGCAIICLTWDRSPSSRLVIAAADKVTESINARLLQYGARFFVDFRSRARDLPVVHTARHRRFVVGRVRRVEVVYVPAAPTVFASLGDQPAALPADEPVKLVDSPAALPAEEEAAPETEAESAPAK